MKKAMDETDRRRKIQSDYNVKHGITPQSIKKKIKEGLGEVFDGTLAADKYLKNPMPVKLFEGTDKNSAAQKIRTEIEKLRERMKELAKKLEFEEAAKIRDEVRRLQILELNYLGSDIDKKDPAE